MTVAADVHDPKGFLRKTREGCNCRFQRTPHTEGWDKVPGSVDPRFAAGCLSLCPKSWNLKHFVIREQEIQQFSAILPWNSRAFPRNSHSLLELSDFRTFLTKKIVLIFVGPLHSALEPPKDPGKPGGFAVPHPLVSISRHCIFQPWVHPKKL